jgi:dihydrofolate reductase
MKSMVVAYGNLREIGERGDMPWHRDLPADLQRFRQLTIGKSVIMGYNTYKSIGRPLAERENIIVTSRRLPCGVVAVKSLEAAYERAEYEPCIIGGAMLYAAALDSVDTVFATEVDGTFPDADTFFPTLPSEWREVSREHHQQDERNLFDYDYVEFNRSPEA